MAITFLVFHIMRRLDMRWKGMDTEHLLRPLGTPWGYPWEGLGSKNEKKGGHFFRFGGPVLGSGGTFGGG